MFLNDAINEENLTLNASQKWAGRYDMFSEMDKFTKDNKQTIIGFDRLSEADSKK